MQNGIINIMKKYWLIALFVVMACQPALAQEALETAIQEKDWPRLAARFADDTHQQLAAYFQECLKVGFSSQRKNELMFFARFRDFAEIGEITFSQEGGQYRQLSLKRSVKPLNFINSFSRYAVADRTLRMGDAEVYLKKGDLYQGMPMERLFIFCGEWEFRIRPNDEEERLTLFGITRSDTFKREFRTGIFVLNQEQLAGLPAPTTVGVPDDEEAVLLYRWFQENWGMHIPTFDELWYFPFAADFNAALFHSKPGKSFYRYVFNKAIAPDTSLVLFPDNKIYLNYNSIKGLKFVSQGVDELENLKLDLFLNPSAHFLSGTAILDFKEPSDVKTVSLDPGLVVKGFGRSQDHELNLFNRGDNYYLLGQELNKFSFYYAGTIQANEETGDLIRIDVKDPTGKNKDRFYILNRDQNFYPNPGPHFFKSRVKITLPDSMQCLASGTLSSRKKVGDRGEFVYESPGSKGVSLVCGNFSKLLTIPGKMPLHIFGNPKLRLRDFFTPAEIRGSFDFLLEKFGPLEMGELNLLLRHHLNYGGLSNQGFVVFNLLGSAFQIDDMSMARRVRRESPVIFTDVNRDGLVHEFAHQWWGGVISWKTYQDQWITEGLAQFATLLYLQHNLPESQFSRAVASAKKWVFRKNDAGPIVYGRRIANLSNDLDTYQSIVYNKSALIFMMLKEILGEEEMLVRLRRLLVEFKYQSLATARFIQQVSQGEPRLQEFFKGWVYSRKIPKVSCQVAQDGRNAEVTITQADSDFVFPLEIAITSQGGKSSHRVIIEKRSQKFQFVENTAVLSVRIDPLVSPIDLQE